MPPFGEKGGKNYPKNYLKFPPIYVKQETRNGCLTRQTRHFRRHHFLVFSQTQFKVKQKSFTLNSVKQKSFTLNTVKQKSFTLNTVKQKSFTLNTVKQKTFTLNTVKQKSFTLNTVKKR